MMLFISLLAFIIKIFKRLHCTTVTNSFLSSILLLDHVMQVHVVKASSDLHFIKSSGWSSVLFYADQSVALDPTDSTLLFILFYSFLLILSSLKQFIHWFFFPRFSHTSLALVFFAISVFVFVFFSNYLLSVWRNWHFIFY